MNLERELYPTWWRKLSPVARVLLLFCVAFPWLTYYAVQHMADTVSAVPHYRLFHYQGTRGPWHGLPSRPDNPWPHLGGAADVSFDSGQPIVWESYTDIVTRTTVSGDYWLRCNKKLIYHEDFQVPASESRHGWKAFGLLIPFGAEGDCEIQRTAVFVSADGGTVEHFTYPVIPFQVRAP